MVSEPYGLWIARVAQEPTELAAFRPPSLYEALLGVGLRTAVRSAPPPTIFSPHGPVLAESIGTAVTRHADHSLVLLFDIADPGADSHTVDRLLLTLDSVLQPSALGATRATAVLLLGERDRFQDSLLLSSERLAARWQSSGATLVVLYSDAGSADPDSRFGAEALIDIHSMATTYISWAPPLEDEIQALDEPTLRGLFDIVYGHFALERPAPGGGAPRQIHTPVVVSLNRVAADPHASYMIRAAIVDLLGSEDCIYSPAG
jgi:hypothetical protein